MRIMPFMKRKKGIQFAGVGLDTGGGGGGSLPIASADNLGGVKIGDNLNITSEGILSADGGGINISTTETKIGTYNGSDLYCKMYVVNKSSSGYTAEYINISVGNHYLYGTATCENNNGLVGATHVDFSKETQPRASVKFDGGIVNLLAGDPITLVVYYTKN